MTEKNLRRIVLGFIATGWTFAIASAIDPLFPDSRGLAFGGPASNYLAFFLFYVGVLTIIAVVSYIAWVCLFRRDD